ncbi:MAG: 4-(cytidine 5'-diphospho)-2-C-methyl-D-erythritol kinase [Bacteroidales bacterium]|nr:4-(cytidine 5'-diphospho)-2-C-methyl-D-erythritol kinase [Bacteroidales bacterium]
MIRFPNAKINLGLNITRRRADGYHDIETVFYPIGWKDALEIVPSAQQKEGCSYQGSGLVIDCPPEKNLVLKAYSLLNKEFPLPPVDVYLHKVIPFGAGLGGGSSDAASMLLLLNEWAGLGLSLDQLAGYASKLGADCSFFIYNKPLFAHGIGNLFEPVQLSLTGYYLALVKPPVFVSTAEAYASVNPTLPEVSLKELLKMPVNEWKGKVANDFEQSVFERYPLIAEIKEQLYAKGALYASMSGSGSSVFGLFLDKPDINGLFNGFDCYFDSL